MATAVVLVGASTQISYQLDSRFAPTLNLEIGKFKKLRGHQALLRRRLRNAQ